MVQVRAHWEHAIWAKSWKCDGSSQVKICATAFQVKERAAAEVPDWYVTPVFVEKQEG